MEAREYPSEKDLALRRKAEEKVYQKMSGMQEKIDSLSSGAIRRVMHELMVHQIELEMQNEELRAAQKQIDASRERYFDLYNLAPVGYITVSEKGLIIEANLTVKGWLGLNHNEMVHQPFTRFILSEDQDILYRHRNALFETGSPQKCDLRIQKNDGTCFYVHLDMSVNPDTEGTPSVCRVVLTDISEQKLIMDTMAFLLTCGLPVTGQEFFASLAGYLSRILGMEYVGIVQFSEDRLTARALAVYTNGRLETNTPYSLKDIPWEELMEKGSCCYRDGVQGFFPEDKTLSELGAQGCFTIALMDSKGKPTGLIAVAGCRPLHDPKRIESLLRLVSSRAAGELERRRAKAKQIKLQAQLTQAQKMESIGRLAGGIAHDFNNMLSVIIGYSETAINEPTSFEPYRRYFQEILYAAKRSSDLTKRLLAFARKQIINPEILNLNQTIMHMMSMLQRLIGEDIDLVWKPAANLWPVKMDPSQLDHILANLCVNSRDAITGSGRITIETDMKTFDEVYCEKHTGFVPGDFVLLSFKDDGCGMDKEILKKLFEPFFTTKGVDKGTGLGLATVYGIVKQNDGFILSIANRGRGLFLPSICPDIWLYAMNHLLGRLRKYTLHKVKAMKPFCWLKMNPPF